MKRFGWWGAVLATALLAGTWGRMAAAKQTPDLSGVWRLDPAHSTGPRFGGGEGREGSGGSGGEGREGGGGSGAGGRRWGGMGGGMGGGGTGGGGMRGGRGGGGGGEGAPGPRLRLTDLLRIEQKGDVLDLSDSTGVMLGEIRTSKAKNNEEAVGVPRFKGSWHGDHLEVVQTNARGGQMTQSYHLSDDGRTLEVRMHLQPGNGMPARDFVRVYQREAA